MTDSSCLSAFIASKLKLLIKGRIKLIVVLLFCFSFLFLTYQLIYYSNLTNYQSLESQLRLSAARSSSSGYHSLKDIASHLEQERFKYHKGHKELPSPPKGDVGPLVKEPVIISRGRGKPIFSEHVLGVSPEAQKYYIHSQQRNRNFFKCLTSGKHISWDKVNDDFCDCPSDGSDEPSTAACMNGRFFCSIVKPEYVPSSFVNDGICDCVDGSDEHQRMSSISCKNRS